VPFEKPQMGKSCCFVPILVGPVLLNKVTAVTLYYIKNTYITMLIGIIIISTIIFLLYYFILFYYYYKRRNVNNIIFFLNIISINFFIINNNLNF
jgi:hypothetical protein